MSRHVHYAPPPPGDPTLFEQEPPSVPVDTSEAAARKVEGKSAYWRAEIYALLKGCGALGATEREIEHALHLSGNTVRPRLRELQGWRPRGKPWRAPLIEMTKEIRDGCRVYRIVGEPVISGGALGRADGT